MFLCKMNLIKDHGGKGSWPFSFERSATPPPQTDHVLVDLFSSMVGGGLCGKAPPHCGTFVILVWPIMHTPLLQVDAEPPVEVQKVWYLPREAIILSTHQKLAYILPEGCDLPLLMPITPVVVYGYRALPSLPRDLCRRRRVWIVW